MGITSKGSRSGEVVVVVLVETLGLRDVTHMALTRVLTEGNSFTGYT